MPFKRPEHKAMKIIADDRESKAVIYYLKKLKNVEVSIQRMKLGDYLVDNHLLFERKTFNDFISSILDGRLFRQATRLASSQYQTVYILEGKLSDTENIKMSRASIQGAIITLTVILQLPLLRSMNPEETANLIKYAAMQIETIKKGSYHRTGYRPKGKRKRQLFILQGLPGIGPDRAKKLLDTFGTIEGVLSSDAYDLAEVEGIGIKTAKNICNIVHENRTAYWVGHKPNC